MGGVTNGNRCGGAALSDRVGEICPGLSYGASVFELSLASASRSDLVISAADCLHGTYDSSFYTAKKIANAEFVGFTSGGHLLLVTRPRCGWR